MPRPKRKKRVCCDHQGLVFYTTNRLNEETITLSTEAFEAFRLIDYEGLTQAEAAERMGVARTTVQSLYHDARKTLAKAIFDGHRMMIEGGDYSVDHHEKCCHEQARTIRLAMMVKDHHIAPYYHDAEAFLIVTMDQEGIQRKDRIIPEEGSGCRKFFLSIGVDHVLTGPMMEHVYDKFQQSHIDVYYAQGDVQEALDAYLANERVSMAQYTVPSEGKDCHGKEQSKETPCCKEK